MIQNYSKPLLSRIENPRSVGSFTPAEAAAKKMRLCSGSTGKKEEGNALTLFLLIDEEDGVIADAKFQVFGPPLLVGVAECICELLVRKNYMQARRLSAEVIEKQLEAFPAEGSSYINLGIDAIDGATEKCMDIPIEDIYIAPPSMHQGERHTYPNWETLSDAQKKEVISAVIVQDVQPYVELDAGGVTVVKVEDNRVTIAYSGNCTSCHSSTGATLDAIGNILRHKIFPDLMVVPDLSLLTPH